MELFTLGSGLGKTTFRLVRPAARRRGVSGLRRYRNSLEATSGCSRGRERERVERFGVARRAGRSHGAGAGGCESGGMMVAAVIARERCDVWNERRDDIGVLGRGDKCGGGACWHGERRDRINQFPPQSQQIGCRLRCNECIVPGFSSGVK